MNVTLKLDSNKIKIPGRNSTFAFICFKNEEGEEFNSSSAYDTIMFYLKIVPLL